MSPAWTATSTPAHPAAPRRCCLATAGPSTFSAPVYAALTTSNWITIAHSHGRLQKSRQPTRRSWKRVVASVRSTGRTLIAASAAAARP